ncbi:MAG: YafY family protein [Eubacteriales bacterium]|nr:YafY family protein [Eubacteriales bacterium]MDD3880674.1 YafY family protein [Eubacteriales bacterium]MDD4511692.1 YafY family protein [Eubacteriales bacterium]
MKLDRLVSIVMTLLQKKRVGARELADAFEVSLRTIYRDIDAICAAGIPVRAVSGAGGGFEIMQEYKVDKSVFSASDLEAILTGLSGFSAAMRAQDGANALAKVRSFIPADKAKDIELKASRLFISFDSWTGKNICAALDAVKTALDENKLLAFDYMDRTGRKTRRMVEPYQIAFIGGQWYFRGFCRTRGDYRMFRLSRISALHVANETFTPRFILPNFFDSPMPAEREMITVKLRIHKSVMDRVLDFCPIESFVADGDGFFFVDFPFAENEYNYNLILGFGTSCECLAPPRIREEIGRRISRMADMYEVQ